MSFSKAKLQRFNDIKVEIPITGTHNIEKKPLDNKLKKDTKNKAKYTSTDNDKNSVTSDGYSVQSVPCAKTPLQCKKLQKLQQSVPKQSSRKNVELEELRDKIVECKNKDAYIKELSEQLEELKGKLSQLETEKCQMNVEKRKYQEQLDTIHKKHQDELGQLFSDNEYKLNELYVEKQLLCEEIKQLKENYEHLKSSNEEFTKKLQQEKDKELQVKEKCLFELETRFVDMQTKYQQEIEHLKKEHQAEVQDLEFEMLKAMTELQKERENTEDKIRDIEERMRKEISGLQDKFSEENRQLHEQATQKIKEIEHSLKEVNMTNEVKLREEMEQIVVEWQSKLQHQQKRSEAVLKECQAISEYNIIQCEVEKNHMKVELDKTTKELKEMQDKLNQALLDYELISAQHKELEEHLRKADQEQSLQGQLEEKDKEISQLNKEKAKYELTIKNSQTTIDVLKSRLFHSDRDVEQLKQEISDYEAKILEYEEKYIKLMSELKEHQSYNDELEMQYESAIKLNCTEIEQLGCKLFKKVDEYRKEVLVCNQKLITETQVKEETMKQLHDAFDLINKMKLELDALEVLNSQYEFEIDQLQNELDDYHMREMDWSLMKEKLEDIIDQMQKQIELKEVDIKTLSKKMQEFDSKLCSAVKYTEYYENKVKEYEREMKESGDIHKKYIEMSGKYDKLSQKFEEIELENVQLKERIACLEKEADDQSRMEGRYQKQKKAYEKLQNKYQILEKEVESYKMSENSNKENTPKSLRKSKLFSNGDKENIGSPNRTLNSSRLESPLRERN